MNVPRQSSRLTFVLLGLLLAACGCEYVHEKTSYHVVEAEHYVHHYAISDAGWFNACQTAYSDPQNHEGCDVTEGRVKIRHSGITYTTHCQEWDVKNHCDVLRVGNFYSCEPPSNFHLMSCKTDAGGATLGVESEVERYESHP